MRDHYEYKEAMFTNSLFLDFLKDNGLRTWKDESTRDIICIEFNFGSNSYQQNLNHLHKIATNAKHEYVRAKIKKDEYLIEKNRRKIDKINQLLQFAYKNKNNYVDASKEDIRRKFYNDGVDVEYITYNKSGEIKKREKIHYKMLYRSCGKAKKGTCMFIRNSLYKKAYEFLYMGIKMPKTNAPIVEASAYIPLVSSGIVGRVKINPKNILILNDVDRFFSTNVISIDTDENKHCTATRVSDYKLKNTLFDGQALIDSSLFPEWGNGYILLRHHFCKMAAFNTNIQKFFKDYFGDDYYTATVKDMFGVEHFVKDIELITTDNAMKWLKFNITYDYWCNKVYENGCQFGIVKTAHESKLGNVQKMSYQMVNSLDIDIMENVCKNTVDFIERLKTDDDFYLRYLTKNKNFSNDYEVLVDICNHNPEFIRSKYFRDRKRKILENYLLNVKNGEIIQDAENLTVVGSPYALLLYAATGNPDDVDNDNTFEYEKDTIQCYTERFNDGDHLAFFRSPFNGKNNLMYLHNTYNDLFKKYFNLGRQVIAINMIGTDAQDRSNGMDMDSDFGYTTNQADIVEHARKCYLNYPTIVNNIPKDKNVYNNTMDDFAKVDNLLSASQTDIGESSNLAQLAQTYSCNFEDQKYDDYVAILSVLAQVAIDNSKRRFDIDLGAEIRRIKNDMDINENKYPNFWLVIKKGFNRANINSNLICPMNYLYDLKIREFKSKESTLPMTYFFNKYPLDINKKTCKNVEEMISKYSFNLNKNYYLNTGDLSDEHLLMRSDFNDLINDLQSIRISKTYLGLMSWLIDRAFVITSNVGRNNKLKTKLNKNRSLLIKVLYSCNPNNLIQIFSKNVNFDTH